MLKLDYASTQITALKAWWLTFWWRCLCWVRLILCNLLFLEWMNIAVSTITIIPL